MSKRKAQSRGLISLRSILGVGAILLRPEMRTANPTTSIIDARFMTQKSSQESNFLALNPFTQLSFDRHFGMPIVGRSGGFSGAVFDPKNKSGYIPFYPFISGGKRGIMVSVLGGEFWC